MNARPLPPARREEAVALWREYTASLTPPLIEDEPPIEQFGDSAAMADELAGLVMAGIKRASADLPAAYVDEGTPMPRIGGHWIVCDGAGRPRCVVRSMELRLGPLSSVDDSFAWDEGEGDRSRASWLAEHESFFRRIQLARGAEWSDDCEVLFERFRVVWPPELADAQ
jgi:uncharacterized protein YhfF